MSLGCGVKAAAFTEVTASAAAQRTDFIVNTAMILNTTITMAQKQTCQPTITLNIFPMAVGSTSCGDVGECRPPRCLSCRRSYISTKFTNMT